MLRNLQFAPGLDDGYRQESPPARSAPPTGAAWPIAITLSLCRHMAGNSRGLSRI